MTAKTALTEAQYQTRVIDYAKLRGWLCVHYRPAANAHLRWATPLQGDIGAPDLLLARDGVVLLAELKTDTGRVSNHQHRWLTQLGEHARIWRPKDWDDVMEELR